VRLSPDVVQNIYLVAALVAFAVIVLGVVVGLLPPPTLLAVVAVPLALRVNDGIRRHYNSPYTLMAVIGTNITLHLAVGGLLLLGYLLAIGLTFLTR
jgi:1,4-dihydroxy-2-naphthoate octaprenyltransferase